MQKDKHTLEPGIAIAAIVKFIFSISFKCKETVKSIIFIYINFLSHKIVAFSKGVARLD